VGRASRRAEGAWRTAVRRWVSRGACWVGLLGFAGAVGLWVWTLFGWCGVSIDDGYWSNSYQVAVGAVYRAHNNAPEPGSYGLHGWRLTKRVSVWWSAAGGFSGGRYGERLGEMRWWISHPEYFLHTPGSQYYQPEPFGWIPLWVPAVGSGLVWLAGRRLSVPVGAEGECAECGYDRAGLAAGAVCPECGAEPD